MIRRHDWLARLHGYIAEVRAVPFEWGVHDCGLFAAGAVEAMTGEDPAEHLRGEYGSFAAAMRRLREDGFIDHIDFAASLFDEIKNRAQAGVGDLAAVEEDAGSLALGVVGGGQIFVMHPNGSGLGTVDLALARRAFRVPA